MADPKSAQPPQEPEKKRLDMKMISKILKTPSESRTQKQCTELLDQICDLQFFKNYTVDPSTANVPKLCCKYMEIEQFEDQQLIFEYGTVGNKFYVVFEGSVGIYVKKPPPAQPVEEKTKSKEPVDPLADFMMVKVLSEGTSFGELALLNNKPRMATIKCLSQTHCGTLSKENFNRILKEHEEQKLNKEIDFFQRIPGFGEFNINQIRFLCLNSKCMETSKNDVIFDEKDPCDSLFIIRSGEFEVFKLVEKQIDVKEELMKQNLLSFSALNKNSNQKVLKIIKIKVLSVGEVIGEECILKKQDRQYKLVCSSPVGSIIKIKASDFQRKISEFPALQADFIKRFTEMQIDNEQRIQKRLQQFQEYKNYLMEDRLPVKLRQSIDRLYSNIQMTDEEKKNGIYEFRQQTIEFENMQKKSDMQVAILSQNAMTQRFSQATPLTFQSQVQFFRFKRLSMLADKESKDNQNQQKQLGNPVLNSMSSVIPSKQQSFGNNTFRQTAQMNFTSSLNEIDDEQENMSSSQNKINYKPPFDKSHPLPLLDKLPNNNYTPQNKANTPSKRQDLSQENKRQISNYERASFNVQLDSHDSPNNRPQIPKPQQSPIIKGKQSPLHQFASTTVGFEKTKGKLHIQQLQFGKNTSEKIIGQDFKRKQFKQSNTNSADQLQYGIGKSSLHTNNNNSMANHQSLHDNDSNHQSSKNIQPIEMSSINKINPGRRNSKPSFEGYSNQNENGQSKNENEITVLKSISPTVYETAGQLNDKQKQQRIQQNQRSYSQLQTKEPFFFHQNNNNNNNNNRERKKNSIGDPYDNLTAPPAEIPKNHSNSTSQKARLQSEGDQNDVFLGGKGQKEQFIAFQFNNEKKRQIKPTLLKDNFIRDWKKNSDIPYEDAQQKSLIKKIKKITSQSEKFTDYLKHTVHQSESIPPLQQQNYFNPYSNYQQNQLYSNQQQLQPIIGSFKPDFLPNNLCSLIQLPKLQDPPSPIFVGEGGKKQSPPKLMNKTNAIKPIFPPRENKTLKKQLLVLS